MSRWKELPDTLDPRARQLVVHLRRLKDHSGLSLTALAAKSSYSRSSWARYLNGGKLPPRQAAEELAHIAGTDPTRLLALHEVAEAVRPPRPAPAAATGTAPVSAPLPLPAPVPGAGPEGTRDGVTGGAAGEQAGAHAESVPGDDGETDPPVAPRAGGRPGRGPLTGSVRGRLAALVLAAVAVAVVAAVALLVLLPRSGRPAPHRDPLTAANMGTDPTTRPGGSYHCHFLRRHGRLYAGHSAAMRRTYGEGNHGWTVVEIQCLLQHAGFSPHGIDGAYGPATSDAVRRLQAADGHIAVDGQVGEQTWPVLRR